MCKVTKLLVCPHCRSTNLSLDRKSTVELKTLALLCHNCNTPVAYGDAKEITIGEGVELGNGKICGKA